MFIGWLISKAYYRRIVRAEVELMLHEGIKRENDMRNMREKYLEDWGDYVTEIQLEESRLNDGNTK
jgi:hypothetical protein